MKIAIIAATVGLLSVTPAFAAPDHGSMHHTAAAAAPTAAAKSEGIVRKIDKAAGKITIAHGPLENLGMPGMTMAFGVSDAAMLDKAKVGDKIRFTAERKDGLFTVTTLEAAK